MPLDLLFWIANLVALAGWIVLLAARPGVRPRGRPGLAHRRRTRSSQVQRGMT
jgi:hypothetical protein